MSGQSPEPDGGVVAVDQPSTAAVDGAASRGWLQQLRTVAALEYRLSIRSGWALALTAVVALLAVALVGVGGSGVGPVRVDAVLVSFASLATYLLPLVALLFGFDAVVGAEDRGWLDLVFALPVSRGRVVVGTFLGRAATLAAATVVGFGVGGALLWTLAPVDPRLFATVVFGAVLLAVAFLALGVVVSTVAGEKTHALGGALLVWVWFVFGHDLVALSLVSGLALPDAALSAMVLSNPAAVFRVLVLSGIDTAGGGMAAVVAQTSLSTPGLVLAAVGWTVAPVVVAARLVRRRSI